MWTSVSWIRGLYSLLSGINFCMMTTNPNLRLVSAFAPLLVAFLCGLTGCTSTSKVKSESAAIKPSPSKLTGESSSILPLVSGTDAFVARMAFAAKAQRTLDAQYYIWHGDQTGTLLAGAMVKAAERGVKVRLLLDDMGTAAKDRTLLILDSHPNIEVRLFNPIGLRSARLLGTLLDFNRVNRRMHNKSFTADDRVSIIGGRNIGDEYFDAAEGMNFADFDVAAKGPVVREVTESFNQYWNCPAAVPITQVSKEQVSEADLQQGMKALLAHRETMEQSPYAKTLRSSNLMTTPLNEIPTLKGFALVVADDPGKVSMRPEDVSTHLAPKLSGVVENTRKELLLVSPYFVPGKDGVAWFDGLRQRAVSVKVITNSLSSNDVAAVHAGYTRYREALLKSGVEVHEMKAIPVNPAVKKESKGSSFSFSGSSISLTGSSRAGLHAKTFVFDRRWVFVGSMNLDPRSIKLNTEIGMIIESPELAEQMIQRLENRLPELAYHVTTTPEGTRWTTQENGQTVILKSEPSGGFKKWLMWKICGMLPIEGQL